MNKNLQDRLIAFAYRLPMKPRRQLLYLVHQGRWARLRNPQLMTEKVNWRILYDRREVLSWTCDKLRMKEEVQKLCPEVHVPRTLWTGTDAGELVSQPLPERWVLKPNHRSGYVHFGSGPVADPGELRGITQGWLEEANFAGNGEWAYSKAERKLFVEEALGQDGEQPADFKFYVFDGRARLVQVDRDRFSHGHSRRHYTPDWEPVELRVDLPDSPETPRPERLEEMVRIAESIGAPFDFMRVDLYCVDGLVYFGEVTPYPASGHGRYEPRSLDEQMGSYWTLPLGSRSKRFGSVKSGKNPLL